MISFSEVYEKRKNLAFYETPHLRHFLNQSAKILSENRNYDDFL